MYRQLVWWDWLEILNKSFLPYPEIYEVSCPGWILQCLVTCESRFSFLHHGFYRETGKKISCFSVKIGGNWTVNSEITRDTKMLFLSPLSTWFHVYRSPWFTLESRKASFPLQTWLKHHFNLSRNSTELVSCSCMLQIGFLHNDRDFLKCFHIILFIWFAIESTSWWPACMPVYRVLLNCHRH